MRWRTRRARALPGYHQDMTPRRRGRSPSPFASWSFLTSRANSTGQQSQSILALCRALLGDGEAQGKFTRYQNIERYRRLLKTATDEERRSYLGRLIDEEKQKQKDAGDSEYQY